MIKFQGKSEYNKVVGIEMRRTELTLKTICRDMQRGCSYLGDIIISLFLWQTLKKLLYREVLAEAKREFGIAPALSV